MEDKYEKYREMKLKGYSPEEVFLAAEADGLESMYRFRVLVKVFGVDVERAKEISIKAKTGLDSIEEHQARVFRDLWKVAARTSSTAQLSTGQNSEH